MFFATRFTGFRIRTHVRGDFQVREPTVQTQWERWRRKYFHAPFNDFGPRLCHLGRAPMDRATRRDDNPTRKPLSNYPYVRLSPPVRVVRSPPPPFPAGAPKLYTVNALCTRIVHLPVARFGDERIVFAAPYRSTGNKGERTGAVVQTFCQCRNIGVTGWRPKYPSTGKSEKTDDLFPSPLENNDDLASLLCKYW